MKNIIEVTPDKNGKYFIKLYGTKYEIKLKNKASKKENGE